MNQRLLNNLTIAKNYVNDHEKYLEGVEMGEVESPSEI